MILGLRLHSRNNLAEHMEKGSFPTGVKMLDGPRIRIPFDLDEEVAGIPPVADLNVYPMFRQPPRGAVETVALLPEPSHDGPLDELFAKVLGHESPLTKRAKNYNTLGVFRSPQAAPSCFLLPRHALMCVKREVEPMKKRHAIETRTTDLATLLGQLASRLRQMGMSLVGIASMEFDPTDQEFQDYNELAASLERTALTLDTAKSHLCPHCRLISATEVLTFGVVAKDNRQRRR